MFMITSIKSSFLEYKMTILRNKKTKVGLKKITQKLRQKQTNSFAARSLGTQ